MTSLNHNRSLFLAATLTLAEMLAPNFEKAKFSLNSAQQRIEIKINYR